MFWANTELNVKDMIETIYHIYHFFHNGYNTQYFYHHLVVKILFAMHRVTVPLIFIVKQPHCGTRQGRPSGTDCQLLTVTVRLRGWMYVFFLDILLHPLTPLPVMMRRWCEGALGVLCGGGETGLF